MIGLQSGLLCLFMHSGDLAKLKAKLHVQPKAQESHDQHVSESKFLSVSSP